MIVKTETSSEGFIYALKLDNEITVYQVYGYYAFQLSLYTPYILNYTIIERWSQNFQNYTNGLDVHDFDIYNQDYILLYTGTN